MNKFITETMDHIWKVFMQENTKTFVDAKFPVH